MYSNLLYIVYELNNWTRNPTSNFPLKNCLFGTVKLVWNAIKNKFIYNGWGIEFEKVHGVLVINLLEIL